MKIIYIFDAFCGWCYGFDKVFTPFIINHPEVDLEIISGDISYIFKLLSCLKTLHRFVPIASVLF